MDWIPPKRMENIIVIIILWKSHFRYWTEEQPAAAGAASGVKNASMEMWGVGARASFFNIHTEYMGCLMCERVRVRVITYNSYQIHFVVVVCVCRKFIWIWFDEPAPKNS